LNKIDAITDRSYLDVLRAAHPNSVSVSARGRVGLDVLRRAVCDTLSRAFVDAEVETAVSNGKLLAYLNSHAIQCSRVYDDGRVVVHCRLPRQCVGQVLRLRGILRSPSDSAAHADETGGQALQTSIFAG
jgi:GTP-binding protein HflX